MDEVRYRKSKLGKLYILSELLISETNSLPPENYSLIDKLSNLKWTPHTIATHVEVIAR